LVAGSNPARPTNVKKRPKGAFLLSAICKIDFSSQVPCSSTDITSYSDED
jgi:transcription elongation factor Elf1